MGWSVLFYGQPPKAHFVSDDCGQPTQQRAKDRMLQYYKTDKLSYAKAVNDFMGKISRTNDRIKLVEALEPASEPVDRGGACPSVPAPMPSFPVAMGLTPEEIDEALRRFDWGDDEMDSVTEDE